MKRRKHTAELKTKVVLELIKEVKSQAEICRENAIHTNLLNKWREQFLQRVNLIFSNDGQRKDNLEKEKAKLEQIIGKQAIEIDFLKRGLRIF